MPEQTLRDYYMRRLGAMRTERQSFISHYRELSDFIQPRRGRFLVTDRNKGTKRHNSIINSKATQAHRVARAGMLAGTMSPARPWFRLETPDPDLMEFMPVKEWLASVELQMQRVFNDSNYYNMASVIIGELLLFGTGCMTHLEDFQDVARFYTHTAGSYMIAQNDRFRVDAMAREFEWTVGQTVKAFGLENASTSIKTAYDKGDYDQWRPLVHFIEPREDAIPRRKFAQFKPYASVYFEPGEEKQRDQMLSISGFDEFPAYCPRWDVTGEDIYGTDCPAITALGDVKGLQIQERRKAQAVDKMVNPPLSGPPSVRNVPVSQLPGGLTVYDGGNGQKQKLEALYSVNLPIGEVRLDMDAIERRIDTAFYVDMFLAISNIDGIQPRNELDLISRNEERLLQLGPVLERLQGEFQDPLINRTFNQGIRAGIFPPPPEELQGSPLKIKYISTLAMAQRAVATTSIERTTAYVTGLSQFPGFENVTDKFDADQAVDEFARAVGTPVRVVVPDDQVQIVRQERQKVQDMQDILANAQAAANTAKMASDAKTGDESLLSDALEGSLG